MTNVVLAAVILAGMTGAARAGSYNAAIDLGGNVASTGAVRGFENREASHGQS